MFAGSVQIISRLDSQGKVYLHYFPAAILLIALETEVHQYGSFILGSVNFDECLKIGKTQRPKT